MIVDVIWNKQIQPKKQMMDDINTLIDTGFALVSNGEFEEAGKIGLELKSHRHTSSFEILALAYAGMEDLNKAIAILEEGIEVAPNIWQFWQLLGNYSSDLENYDKSIEYYERGIQCPDANINSLKYNLAVLYSRLEEFEKSNEIVDEVNGELFEFKRINLKMENLIDLGRPNESIDISDKYLEKIDGHDNFYDISDYYAAMSEAFLKIEEFDAARTSAHSSVTYNKHNERAQYVLRELNMKPESGLKYLKVIVEGVWSGSDDEKEKPPVFFTTYDMAVKNNENILELIKPFEPPEVFDSLRIEEINELESDWDGLIGIYKTYGYQFYEHG
ncbi:MAG: hypothetical protein AAGD25_31160 [Cyanobacteria bacterium P01_F01_bin.150]